MKELMHPAATTPLEHLATRAARLLEDTSGDEVLLRSPQLPGGAPSCPAPSPAST